MRKVHVFAATTIMFFGVFSFASANGTVQAAKSCPKPIHHKHHPHQPKPHCEQPCTPSPTLHSGFFGGVKGGYAWAKGKSKQDGQGTATGNILFSQHSNLNIEGGEIGLFLGYDHYFPSQWVLGAEGGTQWTNLSGKTRATTASPGVFATSDMSTRLKSDWSYDLALRLGRKVLDCSLLYVKVGAQFTHFKLKTSDTQTNTAISVSNTGAPFAKKHKYRSGFLSGFGFELPMACHWSFGVEYTFTWYQRITATAVSTDGSGDFIKTRIRPSENQLLARIMWKQ